MLMAGGCTVGYIKEEKLTKHVCQQGKSSPQTGDFLGFRLLSTYMKTVGMVAIAIKI